MKGEVPNITPPPHERDSFLGVEVAGSSMIISWASPHHHRPGGAKQMKGEGGVSQLLKQLVRA